MTLDQKSLDALRAAVSVPKGAPIPGAAETSPAAGPAASIPVASASGRPVTAGQTTAGDVTPKLAGGGAGACASPGAPVNVGQIGSFGGVAGPLTASTRTGLAIWAKHVNAKGGLACHPINLYAVDDGGDPSRAAALVGELVSKHQIQALVGVMTFGMAGLVPAVERAKLPVIGGDMIAAQWFDHPLLFPQGGGLDAMIDGAVKQSVDGGKSKHGLIYCVEVAVCADVGKQYPLSGKKLGAQLVYSSPVSVTQTDFTAQCQNAKSAGVQALGVALEGSAIARVARSCAALGYHPQFVMAGGVITSTQAEDPGMRKNTIATASSNAPWMRTDTPGQKEYAAALNRLAPGMVTDGPSMIGWTSGMLFEAAVAALGATARSAPITTPAIMAGLGEIRNETLDGLSPPITFRPGQVAAPRIHCVFLELLTTTGWTAPNGSDPVCIRP